MPAKRDSIGQAPVIPCSITSLEKREVIDFAERLKQAAAAIVQLEVSATEFAKSRLFQGAIERLRGQRAATMGEKRCFINAILTFLEERDYIKSWKQSGSSDRHDYEIQMPDGRKVVVEAKGCLDGNNTNIFQRPPQADEFVMWSLCQNAGADPRKNLWSGVHTRLSAHMIHRRERVDGLVVWDMLCGTLGRPCPKLETAPQRSTTVAHYSVPPPCIYLFPRSIPDPRNNPAPPVWKLDQVSFLSTLHGAFSGDAGDVTEVHISAAMSGATVTRTTRLVRDGVTIYESKPTSVKRAVR